MLVHVQTLSDIQLKKISDLFPYNEGFLFLLEHISRGKWRKKNNNKTHTESLQTMDHAYTHVRTENPIAKITYEKCHKTIQSHTRLSTIDLLKSPLIRKDRLSVLTTKYTDIARTA